MSALNSFSQILVESTVDKIIQQIRDQISLGVFKPGDKLPSERVLSEQFGVGRTQLRDALRKMEFYGILKTLPQSGTVVAGLGIPALQGLITEMLNLEAVDFKSLVESRIILETNIAQLAAQNRTLEDLVAMEEALNDHRDKLDQGEDGVEEDFIFHLKIADACKNSVLKSLMLIITPESVQYFRKHKVCADSNPLAVVDEHLELLNHIRNQDSVQAGAALSKHLENISAYAMTIDKQQYLGADGKVIFI
ncbi:MAG: FadR/GntR family transcriptional regulator [Flavobacteriales bacterium]